MDGLTMFLKYFVVVYFLVSDFSAALQFKTSNQCPVGWTDRNGEKNCTHCHGRVRLTDHEGSITDGALAYSTHWTCAWLVDSGPKKLPITFSFQNFSTECGWDHLYIHDGGSAYDPLKASYSGLLMFNDSAPIPDVTIYSGLAYVHFYSDAAYSMDGFNMTYRFLNCTERCQGNRECIHGQCVCKTGWQGSDCQLWVPCMADCTQKGCFDSAECACQLKPSGGDCEHVKKYGHWSRLAPCESSDTSHQALLIADLMWVIGGESFDLRNQTKVVPRFYNITSGAWHSVAGAAGAPLRRYGHSAVLYKDSIYMFGGTITRTVTSQLWRYDVKASQWENIQPVASGGSFVVGGTDPIGVTGHTAHVIGDSMYVVLGYSPTYGFMRLVQEYDFKLGIWVSTTDDRTFVRGSYGHSSVYDDITRLIYMFGGFRSLSATSAILSDSLHSYNPDNRMWVVLSPSRRPSYLHSAVITHGRIVIFGGNPHNDTTISSGAKCYSDFLLVYDISCDKWLNIEQPASKHELSRYGHSAVLHNNDMYIYGGFTGVMMNDLHRLTFGQCSAFTNQTDCDSAHSLTGSPCLWNTTTSKCQAGRGKCAAFDEDSFCKTQRNCHQCVSTPHGCIWSNKTNRCHYSNSSVSLNVNLSQCDVKDICVLAYSCKACSQLSGCMWKERKCVKGSAAASKPCPPLCMSHTGCENCTAGGCMWCSSEGRCVDTNSYIATFPYGKCMHWTTKKNCTGSHNSDFRSCAECNKNPLYGWCNDPSDTGVGECLEGGMAGPRDASKCVQTGKRSRWYFVTCPTCQCNGHSICDRNGGCVLCDHNTTGPHCEVCQRMFFGHSLQGGSCTACSCNNQADSCHPETGKCYCRTRGVTGQQCNECDIKNNYSGDSSTGKCYYTLAIDYQYTFNLSKDDDMYYSQIIFKNTPLSSERDVEFKLNCTSSARINITVTTISEPEEKPIAYSNKCGFYDLRLRHDLYGFGGYENASFYVYVYDFNVPFKLMISFVQPSWFNIALFVAIFFSCFLFLMLVAAAGWKIKQKYDIYRQRRRMLVQMEILANRPFGVVNVEIEPRVEVIPISALAMNLIRKEPSDVKKRKKTQPSNKPSPVATQPYKGTKSELVTLLVRLPTGDEEYTPNCQSGLAFATALTYTGNPRKTSLEHGKLDKRKAKKQPQVACIPPAPPPQPAENIV